jgi:hypothetical protein
MGQILHPFSHIASILPGYWNGKAIEWITFLKLLSLGITQMVLFAFLRKLRLNILFSFILSFITVYNLKLSDMFRHGASLEAYTWHFILCAVIGWYFIRPTKWTGPLLIIGNTWLLLLGGHVEEIYYGMIAVVFFTFIAPYFISSMLPEKKVDFKIALRFWSKTGSFIFLGVLLSAVFVLPFYFDFLVMNIDRVNKSYAFANRSLDTFIGTVNNFFLPLRSDLNTAFGGVSLIIIPVLLPVLTVFKIKIPRSVWMIWGMLLFLFLHIQGDRTPVHKLVWEYFPLASSVRAPGRISIIMPFFMMLLLAWVIKVEPVPVRLNRFFASLSPLSILAFIASFSVSIYYLVYITGLYLLELRFFEKLFHPYLINNFQNVPFWGIELVIFISGLVSLLALAFYGLRNNSIKGLGVILIALTLLQTGIVIRYRSVNWIEPKHDTPTFAEMQLQKRAKMDYPYYSITGFYSSAVKRQLTHSFIEPFLGKIFTQVIPVNSTDEAYTKMQQERIPQQVFIEGYNIEKAKEISEFAKDMKEWSVKLVYSSFNMLKFKVSSEVSAILGLSYPYSGNWRAWVNSESTRVYRANGSAHAVEIPSGDSLVEFRYWSDAYFWGVIVSCTAFSLIGLFVCSFALRGPARIAGIIIVILIGAGGFVLWYNSLYDGDNLETEYTWTFSPPSKALNLAYGKKNWLDPSVAAPPLALHDRDLEIYSGLLVDGDRRAGSGFTTRLCDNPAWILDLSRPEKIKEIVLYESDPIPTMNVGPVHMLEFFINYFPNHPVLLEHNALVNIRPLEIALSNDSSKWQNVASVVSPSKYNDPLSIMMDTPQTARYIRIKSSGKSKLSFDEVEVYGPRDN